jgi:hypothetical protein
MRLKDLLFLSAVTPAAFSCRHTSPPRIEGFQQKWYAGKAELSSYSFQQAAYGEIGNGEAGLVFVAEDFSTNKLVKLDEPNNTSVRVPKMNMTKKFNSGIYPYSMMLSVFTPLSNEGSEKIVKADCSSEEWLGHTFSKFKLDGRNYNSQLHSYFEKEVEQKKKVGADLLEDEIWNRIRINPHDLPQGKVFRPKWRRRKLYCQ